jgi:hypothetical protein
MTSFIPLTKISRCIQLDLLGFSICSLVSLNFVTLNHFVLLDLDTDDSRTVNLKLIYFKIFTSTLLIISFSRTCIQVKKK